MYCKEGAGLIARAATSTAGKLVELLKAIRLFLAEVARLIAITGEGALKALSEPLKALANSFQAAATLLDSMEVAETAGTGLRVSISTAAKAEETTILASSMEGRVPGRTTMATVDEIMGRAGHAEEIAEEFESLQNAGIAEDEARTLPKETMWEPPEGATPKPAPGASRELRRRWLQERFQMHIDEATGEYDAGKLTDNQWMAAKTAEREGRDQLSAYRGTWIHERARTTSMLDPELADVIAYREGVFEPDWLDTIEPDWFDATTRKAFREHVTRYTEKYGKSGALIEIPARR